jgi:hypothetical protein
MKLSAKIAAVELDGDEVRVVVVKTGGRKATVLEAHAERAKDTTPEERRNSLVQAIRDAVGRLKSKPALFVLCVGSQYSMVRTLAVPFRGSRRVASAVVFELEPYLAVPIDELIVDHCTIREVEGETEVLAVGVRTALLEEQVGLLEEAGVKVESITLDAAGLTTLWMNNRRSPAGLHAIFHVRENASILTITYNRSIAFFRQLAIPATRLREDPLAVSREVRNSLRAFLATWRGGETVSTITVTGVDLSPAERDGFEDGMQVPVTYERMSDGLKGTSHLEVNLVPPGADSDEDGAYPAHRPERPNYWEAVVGAAVSAAGGGVGFEFRKGALAPVGALRNMVLHAVFSAALLVLVLAGFATYAVVDYRRNKAEIERCGDEVWRIYSETFPDSEIVQTGRLSTDIGGIQSIQAMGDAIEKAKTQGTQVPVELLTRPAFLEILKEISQKLPAKSVQVKDIKIRDNRGQSQTLTIEGEVEDVVALNEAFDELKKSTLMQVGDELSRHTTRDGKTGFTITANI